MNAQRFFTRVLPRRGTYSIVGATRSYSAPSYQSYPLHPNAPPPPRNDTLPESSITKPPMPKVNETRQPKASEAAQMSEGEAQQSRPVAQSSQTKQGAPAADSIPSAASQSATTTRQRPKLRPREAAMKLTPTAVEQLRSLLDQPEPKLIKVGVRNRGCSGLAYSLEYVDKPGPFDEEVVQDGVKVLVDSKALFSIIGSEMDWVEDKLNQRFVFKNPNIKEECGCGESFMV